ncbi:uncharacterized protein LOC121810554 [Salvia splendens]|uniref:uncharacterized protein LOC121810554 n=1 Tax=Salvia splendens TaxID=180675 RepID=UPI001C252D00|nr:uncharacterized protein LOC121810554 [Salvia splendens]
MTICGDYDSLLDQSSSLSLSPTWTRRHQPHRRRSRSGGAPLSSISLLSSPSRRHPHRFLRPAATAAGPPSSRVRIPAAITENLSSSRRRRFRHVGDFQIQGKKRKDVFLERGLPSSATECRARCLVVVILGNSLLVGTPTTPASEKRRMIEEFYGMVRPEVVEVHPPDVVKTKGHASTQRAV